MLIVVFLLLTLSSATSQTGITAKSFPTNFNNADIQRTQWIDGEIPIQ